jgi:hypothetical protein
MEKVDEQKDLLAESSLQPATTKTVTAFSIDQILGLGDSGLSKKESAAGTASRISYVASSLFLPVTTASPCWIRGRPTSN